ncbi:unnamed protein product [Mytilus coruscus]|uniref:Peptidase A2 domain-containing protein n=1 Tax=Mytilus coruscus TaxID=42192 RepID=A0A6J8E7E3_MYTCO|nr:unnamed protein product [Mytilus coruscus]
MISSKRKLTNLKVKDPKLDTLNHRVKLLTTHKLTTKNVISVATNMKEKRKNVQHGEKTCDACKSSTQSDPEEDDCWLNAITGHTSENVIQAIGAESKNISALMNVNDCDVRFQLDSAADVNTICKRYIRKEQVKPSTITLRMWNKTPMKPIGEVHLKLINPKNGDETMATLVVVPNGHMNLLGLDTIRRMGLITVNDDRFIAKVETQKIGDLGEITLKVDENIPAKKHYQVGNCRSLYKTMLRRKLTS